MSDKNVSYATMLLSGALLLTGCAEAADTAQNYPQRPIRLVVPFAAGGNADIIGRMVGQRLGERLGQNVVVDNRAGANSIIGTDLVAKSPADGYTLLLCAIAHATNLVFATKLPFDPQKDFMPISLVATTPLMMVTNVSFPPRTVRELIAYAQARPGRINYSTAGNGSAQNLAGALFSHMAHVDIVHVPYKGSLQSATDVIGGQIEMTFGTFTFSLPHVKSGRLRALGMTGAQRSAMAPEIPTIAESGLPGYEMGQWNGILAPRGTSQAIIARLNREIAAVMAAPDIIERYSALGGDPITSSPEEFARYLQSEIGKWQQVARASGIRVDLTR